VRLRKLEQSLRNATACDCHPSARERRRPSMGRSLEQATSPLVGVLPKCVFSSVT